MSNFRTTLNTHDSTHKFDLHHTILTLGSCFANVIGTQLQQYKVHVSNNPFGTTYNPISIHKLIQYTIDNTDTDLSTQFIQREGVHAHYDFHTEFSSLSQTALEAKIKDAFSATHAFLKKADWLIITYGTAWVYTHNATGAVVSNCHKMPSHQFTKSLLTHKKILNSFHNLYHKLKEINTNVKIILTVSPVRHLKDTLQLNSVSKAVLRLACHSITASYADVAYFPAYEIMIDDLRDYRFYKSDMIHPTAQAEAYIWQHFLDCYASHPFKSFVKEWKEILASLAHRPFHPSSTSHQTFLKQLLKRLQGVENLVDVSLEKRTVMDQIIP